MPCPSDVFRTAAELSLSSLRNEFAGADSDRDAAMEVTVSTLTNQIGGLMESHAGLQSSLVATNLTVRQQTAEISTLKSALRVAVAATTSPGTGSAGSGPVPVIQANGNDVLITAPNGAVKIASESCGTVDMCDVASFTESLRESLRDL